MSTRPTTAAPDDLVPVGPALRAYVSSLALVRGLRRWANRHGDVVDESRFGPTCMTMATAAPAAAPADLEIVARQALLLWAVDDELEAAPDPAAFVAGLGSVCAAVAGRAERPTPGVRAALAELRADLSGYPLFAELGDRWTDSMVTGIAAGFDEWQTARAMANGAAPPSVDTYLSFATKTILKVPMMLAMLIVTERESLAEHWDRLGPAIEESAVAIRLVNDYGSYERETRDGDLNIRMLGVGMEQLRQDVHASVDRFRAHLGPLLGPEPLRAAVTLDRYVTGPVELYLWTDYKSV